MQCVRKLLTEHEFKQIIKEVLAEDLPDDVRAEVERAEMHLASPGDWEAAKHTEVAESE